MFPVIDDSLLLQSNLMLRHRSSFNSILSGKLGMVWDLGLKILVG